MEIVSRFLFSYLFGILHECCHFAVAKACRIPIKGFSFWLWGTGMVIEPLISPPKEFVVSLAGPAFHLFMLPVIGRFPDLRAINLAMLLVNLLPVLPLDGGRIVKCALLCFLPVRRVRTVCYLLAGTVGTLLTVFVTYCAAVLKRPTAAVFLILFLLLSVHRIQYEDSVGIMRRLAGSRHQRIAVGAVYLIREKTPGIAVLNQLFITRENLYLLEDRGRISGFLLEGAILSGLGKCGSGGTLQKIFREAVEKNTKMG